MAITKRVGRFEEAITAHQDATVIFRETGDRHRKGLAMINLGIALQQVRKFDEAITAREEAAAIFRETEDQHNEQIALSNLEDARAEPGRHAGANRG